MNQSSQNLYVNYPLQTINENQQESRVLQRKHKDNRSSLTGKSIEQGSISGNAKLSKSLRAQENNPNKSKNITKQSKPKANKEDIPVVSSVNPKSNKTKEKNEKNFKDLNKSLANLALRRFIGRSSSDNDAINYINNIETDPNHQSQGPSNRYFDPPLAYNSPCTVIKTPSIARKINRGHHTSVQKDYDITPFALQHQENRESDRFHLHAKGRNAYSRDLTISDLDYGKFQGVNYGKSVRTNHNNHYLPMDGRTRNHGRNFITEGSYRVELSNLDNIDYLENQTLSQYCSNDMQTSQLHGEYGYEFISESIRENDTENQINNIKQINEISNPNPQVKKSKAHKKRWSGLGYLSSKNETSTLSFKEGIKGPNPFKKKENQARRLSEHTGASDSLGLLPKNESKIMDKLEQNHISDGVEYTMGGLGKFNNIRKKMNIRNKSSFTPTESNSRASKLEGFESVRKEALDSWKQDILRIRKDIETRKRSYAEVQRFVTLYEDEGLEKTVKDSRENSVDHHRTLRKHSVLSHNSQIRPEKIESSKQAYFAGLRGVPIQESVKPMKREKKKISFELKTTDDCDDQKSGMVPKEEQVSPTFKTRINTISYYEFNQETRDLNYSFVYDDQNIVLERAQKPPCCGNGKMCNIF